MAKTLGFAVSSSKFGSSAHLSYKICSSSFYNLSPQVSTCAIRDGLRLTVNCAGKPGVNVAGLCRSCLNPRTFPKETIDSSTSVEEISWDLGVRVGSLENAKHEIFRNENYTPVACNDSTSASTHVERAWDHWNKLGAPKLIVAPMMDQSELPFRMLCRKYGATAAYTQMLHSRPFALQPGYRRVEFSTCPVSDRSGDSLLYTIACKVGVLAVAHSDFSGLLWHSCALHNGSA